MQKLNKHLHDSLRYDGSIIDFRAYDPSLVSHICKVAHDNAKRYYGINTFSGLPSPTKFDQSHPSPNAIRQGQYKTNKIVLDNAIKDIECGQIITTDNYNDLSDILPNDETYCFGLIDVKQYEPTKKCLEYLWDHISYGGTIFISHYNEQHRHSSNISIKQFIDAHQSEIDISRQMMVNGIRESFIAIKCYPSYKMPHNWKTIRAPQEKVTIALVLKTGGEIYDHRYVNALAKSIKANITIDHELVCLTDDATGISNNVDRIIPLTNDYPTWWSKIELFKPNQFTTKHVFYMDLDTLVVGNIDDIMSYDGDFTGLRDFYSMHSLGSGIMAWNPSLTNNIYTEFVKKSRSIIVNYREGDQRWIDEHKPSLEWIQDIYPNKIVSFKKHCMKNNEINVPDSARIICFHGNPRPHTIKHDAITKHWHPN